VLARYLSATVEDPALRWKSPPAVHFGGAGDQADFERVVRAVQLVNTILPEGFKMEVPTITASTDPGRGNYFSFDWLTGLDYWGITHNSNASNTSQITHSLITVNKDYTEYGDRQATILLAHELLHALGMFGGDGHVSADVNSILRGDSQIYASGQAIPQPLSLLYPADREAMRALYSRLRDGSSPTDFGPWKSTSWHLVGRSPAAAFGVALRNRYVEPWAYGDLPAADLADNRSLSGRVTWLGTLLGFGPDETVSGDASIAVELSTLTGRADFTNLEAWSEPPVPGAAGTGTVWLDGDLGYAISVRGNSFRETSGNAGRLTGIFTGQNHEGAAGTLERDDLVAAFGASR